MKLQLSTPALTIILVLFAGIVFPIIFSIIDKLLRSLFIEIEPTILMSFSFSWLLFFYYYGIKFSIEYIVDQFEIDAPDKLFNYSNLSFASIAVLFYMSLISAYWLSNVLWGGFYLATIGFFYYLSSQKLLKPSA